MALSSARCGSLLCPRLALALGLPGLASVVSLQGGEVAEAHASPPPVAQDQVPAPAGLGRRLPPGVVFLSPAERLLQEVECHGVGPAKLRHVAEATGSQPLLERFDAAMQLIAASEKRDGI